MIHILFVGGSFGSMLEWSIHNYSNEYPKIVSDVLKNGAMHSFKKSAHVNLQNELLQIKNQKDNTIITTTTYPMSDFSAVNVINFFKTEEFANDTIIFVSIKDLDVAEITLLLHYQKISIGENLGLDSIFGKNNTDLAKWNPKYVHWTDMQLWECREWLSLYYEPCVKEWINVNQYTDTNWLVINPIEIVNDYFTIIKKCIEHSGLTYKLNPEADVIAKKWQDIQHRYFNTYNLIKKIVDTTLNDVTFEWNPLNLVEEAIIQRRLRRQGYKIKCYNLNLFPTNSNELRNLVE